MNLGVLTVALLMAWENPTVNTELPRQTSFRSHKVTHRVVSSSTKGNAGDDTIHRTLNLMDIMDLKTIVEKDGPIDPDSLPHQINVLALGGAYCGQEELGFQFMLGTPNVDHIHNDEYMSMCGDSTLSDVDSKNYDIILMMIPNDGLEGFPTLLLCCKHRYPEAVIIYVRTWNFKQLVHVEGNSSELVKFDTAPPIEAKWTTGQGGHAYQMPLPNSVAEATEWFSEVVCFSKRILSNKGKLWRMEFYSYYLIIMRKFLNQNNLVLLCLFRNIIFIMFRKAAFGRQVIQRDAWKCFIQEYRPLLLG